MATIPYSASMPAALMTGLGKFGPRKRKDVLRLWIEKTKGAKFWLKVVNDLKARGGQSNATARIGEASAPISLSGRPTSVKRSLSI